MALDTNSNFIANIMLKLGNRTDTSLRSSVVDEIAVTKQRLERGRFLPWFLQYDDTLAISEGTENYNLPSTFLREVDERAFRFVDTNGSKKNLKKAILSVLRDRYLATTSGYPTWYSIDASVIYIFATPSIGGTLYYSYYKSSDAISDNTNVATNPWLLYGWHWFSCEVLSSVATNILQNRGLGDSYAAQARTARDELYVHHESRVHTNMDYTDDSEHLVA